MKSEAVKLIEGPYKLHYVKAKKSKVFLPIEMEEEMYNKIHEIQSKDSHFDLITKYLNMPMIFYPKSEKLTLMNFGPYTSILGNHESISEIAEKMYAHTQKVLNTNPMK